MEVRWDIYTVAGRRVRTVQETFAQAGPRILEWDGRDTEGDEIGNGTYLYVVRGLAAGGDGRDITRTGKLVIMR
jgi:flagellar hook assembly protein FlgD